MPFQGGSSNITLKKQAVVHTPKYGTDPEEDRVSWSVEDADTGNPVSVDGSVVKGTSSYSLPSGEFYSNVPGIYSFDYEARVAEALVAKQPQQVRIVDTFRRYLVPHTHCVVDINKPFISGELHVLVGETIEFTILHPLVDSQDSDVGIEILPLAASSKYTKQSFVSTAPGSPVYKVRLKFLEASTSGYTVEYHFMPYDTLYLPLSLIPASFTVKVYDTPVFLSSVPAVLDDSRLAELYDPLVFPGSFQATVRTIGAAGSVSGDVADGATITVTGSTISRVTLRLQDNVSPVTAVPISPDLGTEPEVDTIDVQIHFTDPVINDLSSEGLAGKSFYLDPAHRYIFHSIPVPFTPTNIPEYIGYRSVIPYYFYIEDTEDGSVGSYPYHLTIGFNSTIAGFELAAPFGAGGTYTKQRVWELPAGSLLTNKVHRFLVCTPGRGGRSDGLIVNGYRAIDFSTASVNATSMSLQQAVEWVSLGNFAHEVFGFYSNYCAPQRASMLVNAINSLYVVTGMGYDVQSYWDTGEGACGSIAGAAVYLLSAGGYAGCLKNEDLLLANFDPAYMDGNFSWNANDGLDFGLPFGYKTSWLTKANYATFADPDILLFATAVCLTCSDGSASHALCLVKLGDSLYAAIDSGGIAFGNTWSEAAFASPVLRSYSKVSTEVIGMVVAPDMRSYSVFGTGQLFYYVFPGLLPADTAVIPSYDISQGKFVLRDANFNIVGTGDDPSLLLSEGTIEVSRGHLAVFGGSYGIYDVANHTTNFTVSTDGLVIHRGSSFNNEGWLQELNSNEVKWSQGTF